MLSTIKDNQLTSNFETERQTSGLYKSKYRPVSYDQAWERQYKVPLLTKAINLSTKPVARYFSTWDAADEKDKLEFPGPQSTTSAKLTHVDKTGRAKMVDVGRKEESHRQAVACGTVILGPQAFKLVKENKIKKGDVLVVAQLAGIMAAKSTASLVPLCHNIPITDAQVDLQLDEENCAVNICASVDTLGRTGVEMESLTAVTVAALTVYDMCKAVSRDIIITDVKLMSKSGGKSGDFVRKH